MFARLIPVGLAALLSTSAATASDVAPDRGARDDVTYGDLSRASFGVQPPRPDDSTGVGSAYDDTRYAPPEVGAAAVARHETRTGERSACTCKA